MNNDHDVLTGWARIDTWLTAHDRPKPTRPRADAAGLDAFEAQLGRPLPAGVRAWWLLPGVSAGHWIPGEFAPVSLEEALETHEIWLTIAEEEGPLDDDGRPETRYRPEFMPIALDPGGDGLIVDLRPGATHGAVLLWDHETWVLGAPLWPSLTSMLLGIADALEAGAPALPDRARVGGDTRRPSARG
ncbi:SMI1/KNR4 family protein [Streptomyces sp. NPDC001822]|uniref:SMI1/KNR4 family protein n=1 Tax=Streptomyces sp. NPDC001822 TaxID=3364614 RepID=UPI0036B43BC6